MRRRGTLARVLTLALAAAPPWCGALGLRSPAKEIVVEGLDPGGSYSLKSLTGLELTLQNTGPGSAAIELRSGLPRSGELKEGYEPAGTWWVSVEKPRQEAGEGASVSSDARLVIPRKVKAGRFQAQWVGTARDSGGLKLELSSRLLLHVGPQPAKVGGLPPPEGWILPAGRGPAVEVPLGRRVALKDGARLKVANLGETALSLKVGPAESEGEAPEGWEAAPDPSFLSPGRTGLVVAPGKVAEAELYLHIPDQPRYRGKRWVFTVAVQDGKAAGLYRVFVRTPEAGRGRTGR